MGLHSRPGVARSGISTPYVVSTDGHRAPCVLRTALCAEFLVNINSETIRVKFGALLININTTQRSRFESDHDFWPTSYNTVQSS